MSTRCRACGGGLRARALKAKADLSAARATIARMEWEVARLREVEQAARPIALGAHFRKPATGGRYAPSPEEVDALAAALARLDAARGGK